MSKALIAGINQVATDKGLDREVIFEAIEAALISAYKRNYGSVANVTSAVDRVTGDMRVFAEREVVEDVMNWRTEVSLEDAKKTQAEAELGDVINVETQVGKSPKSVPFGSGRNICNNLLLDPLPSYWQGPTLFAGSDGFPAAPVASE